MMDNTQVTHFVDYMIGHRSLGVDANGQEIVAPMAPEMLAFVVARLGKATPHHGFDCFRRPEYARAMAALLREVADALSLAAEEA
jgi:hypothetical protein